MIIEVRPVNRRMTAEASPLEHTPSMVLFADDWEIHLSVAAQTEIIVRGYKHFGMHRSMHLMAGRATFTESFMFKDKRAALIFMTVEAGFIDTFQCCCGPGSNIRAVGTVAGRAIHFSFEHGMVMGAIEFYFFVRMTLETSGHIRFRIQDISFSAACVHVQAGRTMAHFTRLDFHPLPGNTYPHVGRFLKLFGFPVVASAAAFRTDVFGFFKGFHLKRRKTFVLHRCDEGYWQQE